MVSVWVRRSGDNCAKLEVKEKRKWKMKIEKQNWENTHSFPILTISLVLWVGHLVHCVCPVLRACCHIGGLLRGKKAGYGEWDRAETWAPGSSRNLHVGDLHATLSHSAKPLLRIELIIGFCRILLTLCENAEPWCELGLVNSAVGKKCLSPGSIEIDNMDSHL